MLKLKDLECILSATEICLFYGEVREYEIFKLCDSEYINDREEYMFLKYGEFEIQQLYDGNYDSICIDLKS